MTRFQKTSTFVLTAASITALSTAAMAADISEPVAPEENLGSIYVRGDIGWSWLDMDGDDDEALTVGVGLGYMWNEILRTDVRLDWSGEYDIGADNVDAMTVLANAYIDIPINIAFLSPYVGAGAGYGWVDGTAAGDDSGFTYALMAGATFDLTESMAIDIGYRFRDISIDGPDFTDHSATAGILFKF
ncbi:MAG TPA: porin family protein [Aestuariivirgaceae bacterium]|nr:porin family protein [Aestuariivirgaceae bacterium]